MLDRLSFSNNNLRPKYAAGSIKQLNHWVYSSARNFSSDTTLWIEVLRRFEYMIRKKRLIQKNRVIWSKFTSWPVKLRKSILSYWTSHIQIVMINLSKARISPSQSRITTDHSLSYSNEVRRWCFFGLQHRLTSKSGPESSKRLLYKTSIRPSSSVTR